MQTVLRAKAGGERGREGIASSEWAPPASCLFLILIDDGKERSNGKGREGETAE